MVRILHADLDAFYASVEQRDQPRLRNRRMAVGTGIILSASYEARALGVRTAMAVGQARRVCPNLEIVAPRMEAYSTASAAVMEVFHDTTPLVEPLSIDEAFLDVSGLGKVSGTDVEIAATLRARVASEVGLPISVGGGSTKFLAKVASTVSKPDGLLVVPDGEELAFLHPLPVGRLWGVGPVTQRRLAEVGVNTVGEVAALDLPTLQARVGKAAGAHLAALAVNADPRSVVVGRRRKSVGAQRSFRAGSVEGRDAMMQVIVEVVDRVSQRLRAGGRLARTVNLRLRFADFESATRARTLVEATDSTDHFLAAAKELLATVEGDIADRGLTKLGVAVSNLESADAVQLGLPFDAPSSTDGQAAPPGRRSRKRYGADARVDNRPLDGAMDEIREKFGNAALTRATLVGQERPNMPILPDMPGPPD